MQFKSKAQFNMFTAVANQTRKVLGLTPKQAKKDIKGKTGKGLVSRVSKYVPKKK